MAGQADLVAELTAVANRVAGGASDATALAELVQLAGRLLGGVGATFIEFGPSAGRIVAASDGMSWALGRLVDPMSAHVARLLDGGPVVEAGLAELSVDLAAELGARGVGRVIGARAERRGQLVGMLFVYFADDGPPGTQDRAVIELCGAMIAGQYAGRAGLPLAPSLNPTPEDQRREEDRSVFLAVAAHELRTPVTVIKGYADTLAAHWDALTEEARREAATRLRLRAGDLTNQLDRVLLAAGASTSEPPPGRNLPFELGDTLRAAIAELPAAPYARVHLQLPATLPKAMGDPDLLRIAVDELLTNAFKYSPADGEVDVFVSADDQTVSLQVADRGIGLAPEHAERAFERYWRVDSGTGGPAGVGLGLFLVRRLVERQKGWVSLRPREGGGTVAEVRLPRGDLAGR